MAHLHQQPFPVAPASCPICSQDSSLFRKISGPDSFGYDLYHCSQCVFDFISPMPTGAALADFYKDYSDIRAEDFVVKANAVRKIDFLRKHGVNFSSSLLDYGCGKNYFVSQANYLFSLSSSLASLNWLGYDKFNQAPSSFTELPDDRIFDAITLWGVIEHVTDPSATLSTLTTMLSPGGKIFVTTIDIESSIPFRYKPPEHLSYWSKNAALSIATNSGLTLVDYSPYTMLQSKNVYMSILLRTMPDQYLRCIDHSSLPDLVEIPTNEALWVLEKPAS